ncbi:MAG: hypothetical protein H8E25_12105 [Planctomycetes bacterium]|nr:hypothetical protein [Planctomycetota bacterium]
MRHIHSFLYFISAGALIAGVIDCLAIALGGSAGNHLLALGLVLLAVGCGMRFNGSGYTPPRASFILLGLAGALPLFAGMAPVSAIFGLLLFLPLRALGANLGQAISRHPANSSLLLFGALFGANIIPLVAVGAPGFIGVWALTGLLQYYFFKQSDFAEDETIAWPQELFYTPFIGGVAVASLIVLVLPYATVFDYATTVDNTVRGNTMLLVFAIIWFSLAAGLADTITNLSLRASSALVAIFTTSIYGYFQTFSTPEVYASFFKNPSILKLVGSDSPMVAEENIFYVPLVTIFCFSVTLTLLAVFMRCITKQRQQFAALVCGMAAVFIVISIAPRQFSLNSRLALTIGTFTAAFASSFPWFRATPLRAASTLCVLVLTCLLLPLNAIQPTIHFAAQDNFDWVAAENSSFADLTHTDRALTHNATDYYFDGRSPISPLPNNKLSTNLSNLFIESLVADNHNPITISKTEQLINSSGNHSLIKLYASAQYSSRRSLLRHELFSQASMRLDENGLCVLRISSDELQPSVAPQIAQSFRDIFTDSKFFVYSNTLNIPYLIFVGSNSPIKVVKDDKAIQINLKPYTSSNPWLLKGPWREVDVLLAKNRPVINPEMRNNVLAADVLSDLARYETDGSNSLLDFFAFHLRAQRYSVHDTYLEANPLSTEASADALDALLKITLLHPQSTHLLELWRSISVVLIESREITWLNHYFSKLRNIGNEHDFVLLALAHAALESLDFDSASALCKTILRRYPQHSAAAAVLGLALDRKQVPRDEHIGHDH